MVEAEKIKAKVSEIYSHNNFMQECGIYIGDMACGSATVAVKVDPERHANLNGCLLYTSHQSLSFAVKMGEYWSYR